MGVGGGGDKELDAGKPGSGSEGYSLGHFAWQPHFLPQHQLYPRFLHKIKRVQIKG